MKQTTNFTKTNLYGNYSAQLEQLNENISNVKRWLSFYDFVNIKEVVSSVEEYATKLNALPHNSSMIINANPFEEGGKIYSRGDIVLKDINGDIHHIESKTSGVYYPVLSQEQGSQNVVVTYYYYGTQPAETTVYNDDKTISIPGKELIFNIQQSGQTYIYGYSGLLSDWDRTIFKEIIDDEEIIVKPVLKFYLGKFQEEIMLEYRLAENNEKTHWEIQLIDDDENGSLFNSLYVKVK